MDFKVWLEDLGHDTKILYRGSPQKEKELKARDFPGVYLTIVPEAAANYGEHVSQWKFKSPPKLFHMSDDRGMPTHRAIHAANKYMAGNEQGYSSYASRQYSKSRFYTKPNLNDLYGAISALSLYPDAGWVDYLKRFGFNGMTNGPDVLVFDPKSLERVN